MNPGPPGGETPKARVCVTFSVYADLGGIRMQAADEPKLQDGVEKTSTQSRVLGRATSLGGSTVTMLLITQVPPNTAGASFSS